MDLYLKNILHLWSPKPIRPKSDLFLNAGKLYIVLTALK